MRFASTATTPLRRLAHTPRRANAPTANGRKLSPQEAKAEAAKLAMQLLKDVGLLFSSGSDDAVQPIDTAPVFADPARFGTLNLLHQGQVVKELQDKYDGKWAKLGRADKVLGYYIAYGNWGVREKFANWRTQEAPYDLPFAVPSVLATSTPTASTVVRRLEPVVLAETPVRQAEFDTSKMDAVTKTFIYLTALVVLLAVARDKKVGEAGRPVEAVVADPYERKPEEAPVPVPPQRRWYYLWLR